jgi:acylphosphatase
MAAQLAFVSGRVQGVGYRAFAARAAARYGLAGYAKNFGDGRVEVLLVGDSAGIAEATGELRRGPAYGEVRHVEIQESAILRWEGFQTL